MIPLLGTGKETSFHSGSPPVPQAGMEGSSSCPGDTTCGRGVVSSQGDRSFRIFWKHHTLGVKPGAQARLERPDCHPGRKQSPWQHLPKELNFLRNSQSWSSVFSDSSTGLLEGGQRVRVGTQMCFRHGFGCSGLRTPKGESKESLNEIVKWSLPIFVKRSSYFHFITPPPQNEEFPEG